MNLSEVDAEMMRRCIALSATVQRDLPIAAMVCRGRDVLATAANEVRRRKDVTGHAEIAALNGARERRGRADLGDCTLYSTVEPCPMCCFAMRELNIGRVVYALASPVMGGVSKWNVLRDRELSDVIPEVFGPVPEVVAGVLAEEAAAVWRKWNPLVWSVVKRRGCFAEQASVRMQAIPSQHRWLHSLMALINE